jgi:hypothetical protein
MCGELLSLVWQVVSLQLDLWGRNIWHTRSSARESMDLTPRRGAREPYPAYTRGYKAITGKCATQSSRPHLTRLRNVGLFHYWTLSNFPLFIMAAPMLWLLLVSSVTVLRCYFQPQFRGCTVPHGSVTARTKDTSAITHDVPELALPQLVLAITATTSFHVQIVNRLASGYPTWYVMVATWLVQDRQELSNVRIRPRNQWVVRGLLIYAMTQGILFANFLPPA